MYNIPEHKTKNGRAKSLDTHKRNGLCPLRSNFTLTYFNVRNDEVAFFVVEFIV